MSAPYVMANAIRVRNFAQQGIEDLEALAKEYGLSLEGYSGDMPDSLEDELRTAAEAFQVMHARASMSGNGLVPVSDGECIGLLAVQRHTFVAEWRERIKQELGEGKR